MVEAGGTFMTILHLTAAERGLLRTVARHSPVSREARRALALLDLDRGESVAAVARRYQVCRDTVYEWADRLRRADRPAGRRLADSPRSGRPAATRAAVERLLRGLLRADPRRLGYRHPVWTAGLLRHHLGRRHGVAASVSTVRRALRRLRYRWKRPRFVLSRRDPHWRQAKGGSGEG
jgi:transposase